jgi:hypothetical protein
MVPHEKKKVKQNILLYAKEDPSSAFLQVFEGLKKELRFNLLLIIFIIYEKENINFTKNVIMMKNLIKIFIYR